MRGSEIYNSPQMAHELEGRYAAGWPEKPIVIRSRASIVIDIIDSQSPGTASVYSDDASGINQLPSTD